MIQIRNVPEGTHRRLKARAAMEGVSMSQYVMSVIERALEKEWQDICTANNSGRSPRFSDAVTNVSHRISVVGMQVELLNADFEKRLQVLETIVTEQVE